MPSGKVHDAITAVSAIPASAAAFYIAGSLSAAWVVGVAFFFGGIMFGPDLDTVSRPYSRWGPIRWMWLPYRHFFAHRSRLSHGLALGALIRVVYFLGSITLLTISVSYIYQMLSGGELPGFGDIVGFWAPAGESIRTNLGANTLILIFAGLWAGAASHTLTDMAFSFIKTGRAGKFF